MFYEDEFLLNRGEPLKLNLNIKILDNDELKEQQILKEDEDDIEITDDEENEEEEKQGDTKENHEDLSKNNHSKEPKISEDPESSDGFDQKNPDIIDLANGKTSSNDSHGVGDVDKKLPTSKEPKKSAPSTKTQSRTKKKKRDLQDIDQETTPRRSSRRLRNKRKL